MAICIRRWPYGLSQSLIAHPIFAAFTLDLNRKRANKWVGVDSQVENE